MKVPDIQGVVRGLDPRQSVKPDRRSESDHPHNVRTADGDSLDVGLSARIMAASKEVLEESAAHDPELSVNRLAEIHERLRSGFYDRPDLIESTGQRILDFYAH
ncbi:hypothetical protein KKH27_12500 [bacterium]|nr:hypothetical protein [bacterium]MBU1984562.1 hypothetical protein [bacterium]